MGGENFDLGLCTWTLNFEAISYYFQTVIMKDPVADIKNSRVVPDNIDN